jgi:hypothetical protein
VGEAYLPSSTPKISLSLRISSSSSPIFTVLLAYLPDGTVVEGFAWTYGDYFTLGRLFSGRSRQKDATCGLGFFFITFNDDAVM